MSEYIGVPQFERVAEQVSQPYDKEAELAHYAEFLWGKNSPDVSQPLRWWFDERFALDLVATDGLRWFIASEDPKRPIQEVFVIDHEEGVKVAGLTHPTGYRSLSPLLAGQTATTYGLPVQYFWD